MRVLEGFSCIKLRRNIQFCCIIFVAGTRMPSSRRRDARTFADTWIMLGARPCYKYECSIAVFYFLRCCQISYSAFLTRFVTLNGCLRCDLVFEVIHFSSRRVSCGAEQFQPQRFIIDFICRFPVLLKLVSKGLVLLPLKHNSISVEFFLNQMSSNIPVTGSW